MSIRNKRGRISAFITVLTVMISIIVQPNLVEAQVASSPTTITGVVQQINGTSLGGAAVTITGPESEATETDSSGKFSFTGLQPGLYRVTARRSGFDPATEDDIVVAVGSTITVRLTLQQSSFSSLNTIGRVTSRSGANRPQYVDCSNYHCPCVDLYRSGPNATGVSSTQPGTGR